MFSPSHAGNFSHRSCVCRGRPFWNSNWVLWTELDLWQTTRHTVCHLFRFLCSGKQVLMVGNVGETRWSSTQTLAAGWNPVDISRPTLIIQDLQGIREDPSAFADILALLYGMPLKVILHCAVEMLTKSARNSFMMLCCVWLCWLGRLAYVQVTHGEMKRWCTKRWWPALALSKELQLPDIEAGLRTVLHNRLCQTCFMPWDPRVQWCLTWSCFQLLIAWYCSIVGNESSQTRKEEYWSVAVAAVFSLTYVNPHSLSWNASTFLMI